MTLSRTARILIALLLVAAAAFVWINFFATTPDTPAPITQQQDPDRTPDADAGPDAEPDAAAVPDAQGDPAAEAARAQDDAPNGAQDGAPSGAQDGEVAAGEDGAPGEPPTVVAGEADVVGRDVEVAEFPFLVTEPPAPEDEAADEAAAAGAGRPGTTIQTSLNPFSPIRVEAAATPQPEAPPASPEVEEVDVPDGPPVEEAEAAAPPAPPAPRALAPNTTGASELPRSLPRGTLPVAPTLLQGRRAPEASSTTPTPTPDRIDVREPDASAGPPPLSPLGGGMPGGEGDPSPLRPGDVAETGVPDGPMVAGADPLSRYLRDHDVTFTGSVVGSVGVGVFRMADQSRPVVLALGQPLPDTDIVLTDLRGQAAEFSRGDTSQLLTLDLRR